MYKRGHRPAHLLMNPKNVVNFLHSRQLFSTVVFEILAFVNSGEVVCCHAFHRDFIAHYRYAFLRKFCS